jgi:hypothetical protein
MAVRLSALRAGRLLPPKIFLVLRALVRLERLGNSKNPVTSSGIESRPSGLYHTASTNYATAYLQFLHISDDNSAVYDA